LRALPVSLFLLLAATTAACAHVRSDPGERAETVRVGDAVFELRYGAKDARAARQVREALRSAVPAAERWGRLSRPVLITIYSTHGDLEAAAHRPGYAWLRAWTRYDSVDLQSPRTWSRGDATDAQMSQLVAHEITHCVMYQAAATELTWRSLRIPLWFREGMATVTAGEHRNVGLPEIGRYYREAHSLSRADADPLSRPEPLYRTRSDLVYGTADSAFRFLLDRYGPQRIRALLSGMAAGNEFAPAFEGAIGIPVAAFEGEFRRYVLLRGGLALDAHGTQPRPIGGAVPAGWGNGSPTGSP
jgi:Peptidase MA superfamily